MIDMGIARHGRYLCYGWRHGFGCGWLSRRVQDAIVTAWNFVACRFGHEWMPDWDTQTGEHMEGEYLVPEGITHEVCMHCSCRRVLS